MITQDKLFIEDHITINEVLISERFYLSGYETILMENFANAIRSILLSTLSFDNKALLVKTGNYKDILNTSKDCPDIIQTVNISLDAKGLQHLSLILETNKNISNLILCVDDNHKITKEYITQLGEICDFTNADLIIYDSTSDQNSLRSYLKAKTSYIVYSNVNNTENTLIIAQRRSLVKTEGISSSFTFNLYKTWQNTLKHRQKHITPMLS